jgi:hypothetical protein
MLSLGDIVDFWAGNQFKGSDGQWSHKLDRSKFEATNHGFQLNFPVSPYVGNILDAPVIMLNLNGGYDPILTPSEFADAGSDEAYLKRVADPAGGDWTFVSKYYDALQYGRYIRSGRMALINACAYRSPNLPPRSPARAIAETLPSVGFHRRWLTEALVPAARSNKRVIVANRWGLWNIKSTDKSAIIFDPAPVSPHISQITWPKVWTAVNHLKQ